MANGSSWNPPAFVEQVHRLPHLGPNWEPVDSTFNITAESGFWNNDYTLSLFIFPELILTGSLVVIFAVMISFSCRLFFNCCRCRPNFNTDSIFNKPVLKEYFGSTIMLRRAFLSMVLFIVLLNQYLFYGYSLLVAAFNKGDDSFNFFYQTFDSLDSEGKLLQAEGLNISQLVTRSLNTCPNASTVTPYIDGFNVNVNAYVSIVGPAADNLGTMKDDYHKYVAVAAGNTFWTFWFLILLCTGLFLFGYLKQSKFFLQFSIWCALFWVFSFDCICCALLVALMGMADFCISPTDNLIHLVPVGDEYRDTISYYSTCTGENPFSNDLTAAFIALEQMNRTLYALTESTGLCPNNPYLTTAEHDVDDSYVYLTDINVTSSCPPVMSEINSILHNSLCFDLFGGFYSTWITQYSSTFFLFILCIIASIVYQYFGRYWGMEKEDLDDLVKNIDTEEAVDFGGECQYHGNTITYGDDDSSRSTRAVQLSVILPSLPSSDLGADQSVEGREGSYGDYDVDEPTDSLAVVNPITYNDTASAAVVDRSVPASSPMVSTSDDNGAVVSTSSTVHSQ